MPYAAEPWTADRVRALPKDVGRRVARAIALALFLMPATTMAAQAPSRFSIAANFGRGLGYTSGDYKEHRANGLAADVLISARLRPIASGRVIVGLSGSAQSTGGSDLSCQPTPVGGCVADFPEFLSFAPLIGWESTGAALRVMVGPSYVVSVEGGHAFGIQGRIDATIVMVGRFAVLASAWPTRAPNFRGDPVGLLPFGLGLELR